MVASVQSAGLYGIEGYPVTVECDLARGLPRLDLVGLPDAAVKEAGDRVRSAIKNCGFDFPVSRITVNLAPADTRKEGPLYDLPILLGILVASGQLPQLPAGCAFLGELSLKGEVRPVAGVLSMAMALRQAGVHTIYVPFENGPEAALAEDCTVYEVSSLPQLIEHLKGETLLKRCQPPEWVETREDSLDFAHVMGQENAKRALEVAVAGGHNILLCGSPGSGKSMMAKCLRSILPPMTKQERLEVIRIHSVCGNGPQAVQTGQRPFIAMHHTVSPASLAGGGSSNRVPKPGEISRAHHGILFLDELPEFRRDALEVLRQPMEDGEMTISRVAGKVTYPSRFMLVCAMNPCKCGWYGHASGRCRCAKEQVKQYLSKISGPLLDRIDIQVEVQPVRYEDLKKRKAAESSHQIRERVIAAREKQTKRFAGTKVSCNAYMDSSMMAHHCERTDQAEKMLAAAFDRLGLTARAYDRVLRVARTIADLDGKEKIDAIHIAESIQYRSLERRSEA